MALYALLRWRADVHPDPYVGSQFRIAGEVVLGLVLLWGLLRLYRALCLRRPVVVDSTHYPATIAVPSPRIARFYRPIVLGADEVLDVELVGHDSLLRGERRFRLAVNTTGGPLLSDAITSPYLRSRPGPALRATEVVDELRRAVRGIA